LLLLTLFFKSRKILAIKEQRIREWFFLLKNQREAPASKDAGAFYLSKIDHCVILLITKRGSVDNAVTLNRYANANPVTNIDPFGLSAERGLSLGFELV
jgi:hypothetical protein